MLLSVPVGAQSSSGGQQAAPDTRARGYWVDPSTGLMWAGQDNFGRDLKWRQATRYCADLKLAGYNDWRLPWIHELEGIYNKSANTPGLAGPHNTDSHPFHVKGNLFLTGRSWSASQRIENGGRRAGFAYGFDFTNGKRFREETYFRTFRRALCVRGEALAESSTQRHVAPDTRARGYWVDPSTGLIWAGKDSVGQDLNWSQASEYCRALRLGRYADWRLPTIGELEGLYDDRVNAFGFAGKRIENRQPFHVRGDLLLTGHSWSASHAVRADGRRTLSMYLFNFINGERFDEQPRYCTFNRALCVREGLRL